MDTLGEYKDWPKVEAALAEGNCIPVVSEAVDIYTDLVLTCGAHDHVLSEAEFVRYVTTPHKYGCEYRFQGKLGFGGKFRINNNGVYVDYYPDDRNEERDAMVAAMMNRLNVLGYGYLA